MAAANGCKMLTTTHLRRILLLTSTLYSFQLKPTNAATYNSSVYGANPCCIRKETNKQTNNNI